jgi:hypothetical protein
VLLEQMKRAKTLFKRNGELAAGVKPIVMRSWLKCRAWNLTDENFLNVIGLPKLDLLHIKKGFSSTQLSLESYLKNLYIVLAPEVITVITNEKKEIIACGGDFSQWPSGFFALGQMVKEEDYGTLSLTVFSEEQDICWIKNIEHYLDFFAEKDSVTLSLPNLSRHLKERIDLTFLTKSGYFGEELKGLIHFWEKDCLRNNGENINFERVQGEKEIIKDEKNRGLYKTKQFVL